MAVALHDVRMGCGVLSRIVFLYLHLFSVCITLNITTDTYCFICRCFPVTLLIKILTIHSINKSDAEMAFSIFFLLNIKEIRAKCVT